MRALHSGRDCGIHCDRVARPTWSRSMPLTRFVRGWGTQKKRRAKAIYPSLMTTIESQQRRRRKIRRSMSRISPAYRCTANSKNQKKPANTAITVFTGLLGSPGGTRRRTFSPYKSRGRRKQRCTKRCRSNRHRRRDRGVMHRAASLACSAVLNEKKYPTPYTVSYRNKASQAE